MAAQLRTRAVPLHPAAHHQAEGTPEVVHGTAAGKVLLRSAEELQAGGGAAVRALRQLAGLRPHHLIAASSPRPLQLHLHVKASPGSHDDPKFCFSLVPTTFFLR